MDEFQALDLARSTVALAAAAGAGEAAVTVSVTRRFHTEARERTVSKLEHSTNTSLHLQVLSEGRRSSLVTSDLSADGLREAVRRAVEQVAFVTPDPLAGLPERCADDCAELHLYDPSIVALDGAEKVDRALELERLIRDADVRVVNSNGSHYSDAVSITASANSSGFAGSYTSTRAGFSTGPVALDGEIKRTAHYGTAGRHAAHLESTQAVARTAARRAVDLFGARKPPTMRAAVIFERDVAAAVIDDLFAALSAANVAVGNSWLIGRTGKRVGSELVTIVDDGRLPARLGSAPFDGEGVATQRTVVFERGLLQSFLYDTYYARKLGARSTGNSSGGGIRANNFYLEPGAASLDDVIASTERGVLVLDTIGFATEHASGTYSRGARGLYIESGEIQYPIDEFTIAGGYADMLAGIDAVADDLRFDASVVSPSFRVAEMTVSGN